MTTPAATAIHCPSCGRFIAEAQQVVGERLRCKACREDLSINLHSGVLSVQAARFRLMPPREAKP